MHQTKSDIAKDIDEANAKECTNLVEKVKADLAKARKQWDEIQDDYDAVSKELDALKAKAEHRLMSA